VLFDAFIDVMVLKQNPSESKFVFRTTNFEVRLEQGYALAFKGVDFFIRSNDISWYLPTSVFDAV
jgi:hypothetical protein